MGAAHCLADFTRAALVIPALRGRDQASVLMELARCLHSAGTVPDLMQFYHAASNREFLESTMIADALAVPHVRVPGTGPLVFALGGCPQPIVWKGASGSSVRWIVLASVPASDAGDYLALLSGLGRMIREPALRRRLETARDGASLFAALREVSFKTAPVPALSFPQPCPP